MAVIWDIFPSSLRLTQRRKGAKPPREKTHMRENEVAWIIVDVALRIHTTLSPGLLESDYESVFFYELTRCGLKVAWRVI